MSNTIEMDTLAGETVALRSASLAGHAVPDRVLLAPWGNVASTNGDFIVDEESSMLVIVAFRDHATDIPIDYEHQTLGGRYAAPDGRAPAAGWIKRLIALKDDGIYGEIEWTDQARQQVMAKAYRYISPVALIRKNDRKLIALHSAALTNKPAIVGMQPIVNRAQIDASDAMNMAAGFNHAKTPDHAYEDDHDMGHVDININAKEHGNAIDYANESENVGDNDTEIHPLVALREELNLESDVSVDEVLVAAGHRLRMLDEQQRQRRATERVAEAVRTGRIVEAQRQWAEELVLRDEACFDEFMRTAPVVITYGKTSPPSDGRECQSRHATTETRARAEYRSNPMISRLTSEQAFVEDALRHHRIASMTECTHSQ